MAKDYEDWTDEEDEKPASPRLVRRVEMLEEENKNLKERLQQEVKSKKYWLDKWEELHDNQTPLQAIEETLNDMRNLGIVDKYDNINKPLHYNSYPGIEVIELTQHMNFCKGNATKYLARAEFKGRELEDLEKARWYIDKEIERIKERENGN